MNEAATSKVQGRIGPGRLVLVVGPSGAGKDTLISLVQQIVPPTADISFPVRTVTREPSAHENNRAVTADGFAQEAAFGAYALWWQAHGHGYGVPRSIDDDLRADRYVVVNVSRAVIADARARYADVKVVNVTAPADVLAERLAARNRSSDGPLAARLGRANPDATIDADVTILNVGEASARAAELLSAILR